MGLIHPAVSEICVPQSLVPICDKFDKFLAHEQAHMGQMGKWHGSAQLQAETIPQNFEWRKSVKQLQRYVLQVWQPPARGVKSYWKLKHETKIKRKKPMRVRYLLWVQTLSYFHWNENIVILMKFSSLTALEVVKMTSSNAASGENFVKMMTFLFQCSLLINAVYNLIILYWAKL